MRPPHHDEHPDDVFGVEVDDVGGGVEGDRDLLMGVALRILGSHADAADAVQEAYRRWFAQAPGDRADVASPTGWLVTVVSRICLDQLKSARARRERYVGPWLPEPRPSTTEADERRWGLDPEQQITLDESVTTAMLMVMEAMTPAERVTFVLHDVFGFPFADIATIVGRAPGACRQLASSGRRKVRATEPLATARTADHATVAALREAWNARDLRALVAVLDPEAVVVVDGGGLVSAPTEPVAGAAAVADLLLDVADRVAGLGVALATVNGSAGLVARDETGAVLAVVAVDVGIDVDADGARITALYVTRNPDKLRAWS